MASILLVDDDELFREVIAPALRGADHAVEEAVDGAQALRILKASTPDILITDIFMPNRDGIELIAAVRQANPTVRIMAISARQNLGMVDLLDLAERLGAHASLAKPFTAEQLLEKLAELERAEVGRT